ncbi:AraC-like DNA-binding protein [Rhodovulum imhoffii]|uniref:AraC-like DNA-binding protein n=1 Tax=Rhodovulum imhoffii TaxID=365340 RepID=A0A2T5BT63_9RHOB|nr:helix-turn-helix domain-containing protein [Rhodovulum imhoffii]MBK5933415.1 hypothetical protein [Rhodovulum imhoffii]PTN02575.1 AraC-like DNA-binding protein [Rhodovulum imhoffii]
MTAEFEFSTAAMELRLRSQRWQEAVQASYYPLSLRFRDPDRFNGRLCRTALGHASLSRLQSDPVSYERLPAHIRAAQQDEYLVTLPCRSGVTFRQLGYEVRCEPGAFLLERGDEPYRFAYEQSNDLLVLKVNRKVLSERVRQPDRFCARVFQTHTGAAALFATMLRHAQAHREGLPPEARETLGRQLLELLGLALAGAEGRESGHSAVRAAHLRRAERFVRLNLKNPELSPDLVAESCGVSKRYLHDLFRDSGSTVGQYIRDQRLIAARDRLQAAPDLPISEVAYRFSFADHAQFSRLFRARFGITPSEFRKTPCAPIDPGA